MLTTIGISCQGVSRPGMCLLVCLWTPISTHLTPSFWPVINMNVFRHQNMLKLTVPVWTIAGSPLTLLPWPQQAFPFPFPFHSPMFTGCSFATSIWASPYKTLHICMCWVMDKVQDFHFLCVVCQEGILGSTGRVVGGRLARMGCLQCWWCWYCWNMSSVTAINKWQCKEGFSLLTGRWCAWSCRGFQPLVGLPDAGAHCSTYLPSRLVHQIWQLLPSYLPCGR